MDLSEMAASSPCYRVMRCQGQTGWAICFARQGHMERVTWMMPQNRHLSRRVHTDDHIAQADIKPGRVFGFVGPNVATSNVVRDIKAVRKRA